MTEAQEDALDRLRGQVTRSDFVGWLLEAAEHPRPGEAVRVLLALARR